MTDYYIGHSGASTFANAMTTGGGDGGEYISAPDGVMLVGTSLAFATFYAAESFLEFDTTLVLSTPSVVTLKLFVSFNTPLSSNITLKVAPYDWGGTIQSSDWRNTTQLQGLTPCGSTVITPNPLATDEVDVDINPAVIVQGGTTRFILYIQDMATPTSPTGETQIFFDDASGTNPPILDTGVLGDTIVTLNDVVGISDSMGLVVLPQAVGITATMRAIIPRSIIYTVTKPDYCRDPSYSPNGNTIVFAERLGSAYNVSTITSIGASHTVLHTGSRPFSDPSFSADGEFVLYAEQTVDPDGGHPYGQWAIRYRDPDGNIVTIVNNANANMHPVWLTPTQVAFQRLRYGIDTVFHIVLMDIGGTLIASIGEGEYPRLVEV